MLAFGLEMDREQLSRISSRRESEDDDLEIIEADVQPSLTEEEADESEAEDAAAATEECAENGRGYRKAVTWNWKQPGNRKMRDPWFETLPLSEKIIVMFLFCVLVPFLFFLLILGVGFELVESHARRSNETWTAHIDYIGAWRIPNTEKWQALERPAFDIVLQISARQLWDRSHQYKKLKKSEKSMREPVCQHVKIESWHAGQRTVNISYMVPLVVMDNIWLPRNISGEIVVKEGEDGEVVRRILVATDFPSHVYVWRNVISLDVEKAYQQKGSISENSVIEFRVNNPLPSTVSWRTLKLLYYDRSKGDKRRGSEKEWLVGDTTEVFYLSCTIPRQLVVDAYRLVYPYRAAWEDPKSSLCDNQSKCSLVEKHVNSLIERVKGLLTSF